MKIWHRVGVGIMRQHGFHTLLQFIDIVTLPEHCQMYPLPFDRMIGAKHLVFMIWTVYKIVMKFYG